MAAKSDWIIGGIIVGIVCIFLIVLSVGGFIDSDEDDFDITGSADGKIALVEIRGPLYSATSYVKQIKRWRKDKSVDAILIRLNSPGGSIAASQEIYDEVCRARLEKPVVVTMGVVAASGAYYIACGADTIIANPGTITGSIGVIFEFINYEKLFNKIGFYAETLKSGKFKDAGSPTRSMTEEDRKYLQGIIDDAYEQFVQVIVEERQLDRQELKHLADGRIFTGKQAYESGLIDLLGSQEDAVTVAAAMADISPDAKVVKERVRTFDIFDLLSSDLNQLRFVLEPKLFIGYMMQIPM